MDLSETVNERPANMPDSLQIPRSPPDPMPGVSTFVPLAPVVIAERILRIQGYSDIRRVRPVISRSAEAVAALARDLCSPRATCRIIPILDRHDDQLVLEAGVSFHCEAFARVLRDCDEVAVFVLTIGPRLDAKVAEFTASGAMLEALLLETAGWLCIEDATRQLKVRLREEANARTHRITSRMGPGHSYKVDGRMCHWPLEEQIALFGLFRGADLSVTVTEVSTMLPKMSRSGLYGIAPL